MGPFPHDAPPATISAQNPAGTDGFEFVEFAHPGPEELARLFARMGYAPVARHRTKDITVYRQGDINYIVNAEPDSFADRFAAQHGPSVPAMAWRCVDAKHAFNRAVSLGAEPYDGPGKTLNVPAIRGIGGSLLYFVERYGAKGSAYDEEFVWTGERDPRPKGVGFQYLDHLTHNVKRGNMDTWFSFYSKLFNFRQIRFFDIEGKRTGLFSRALTSPCGRAPRSRNIFGSTRERAYSTSRSGPIPSTMRPMPSRRTACSSCPGRRTPTTTGVSSACAAITSRLRA
jgi:4-hydroxyphenylpyruvate dioxygenase